ncbi:MAG: peptidylprolyl isomerase [Rhodoferax sp.]|nr:peptidylprolyl isomerase [Rhodoferax sp.]
MFYRFQTLGLLTLAVLATGSAPAQGLRATGILSTPAATLGATPVRTTTAADFIVAVVNSEPITNHEVRQQLQRVVQQLAAQRRPSSDLATLAPQVLNDLINQKAQLQLARDLGLRVEDAALDQAEQSIALQNQIDVAELRRRLERDGQSVTQFRAQLHDQILLQRLIEREVEQRVRVSDAEVQQYLHDQQTAPPSGDIELNLAQILVTVPESATPEQLEALKARAQRALDRARKGEDFATLVREFSDATDLSSGGQLGLRTVSRYPDLFAAATQALTVGDVTELVRSPAGFHVLKVIEKINPNLPTMAVTQSHARHILLVPGVNLSEAAAREKLSEFKKRVVNGKADFAALAREHSQDGSAAKGGDLGWSSPGTFVPEFETTLNRLTPGEVSDPLLSRFGLHLIQLLERRKASLAPEQQLDAVRALLRDKKADQAYRSWLQEVRARAYVELREPPL